MYPECEDVKIVIAYDAVHCVFLMKFLFKNSHRMALIQIEEEQYKIFKEEFEKNKDK